MFSRNKTDDVFDSGVSDSDVAVKEITVKSHDGVPLRCVYSEKAKDYPWIVFVLPFGLEVHHARAFFDFFGEYYNIFSWQARLILDPPERELKHGELTVDNHVQDLFTIMDHLSLDKVIAVGYCSGAGISLAAANQAPHRFMHLVLVNGEYTLMHNASCVTQFGSDIDNILSIAAQDMNKAELIFEKIKGNVGFSAKDVPHGIDLPFSESHYLHRHGVNYLAYRECDFEECAKNITHDTYMLAGGKDAQSNLDSSQTIKSLIEKAELYVDPDGDHYEVLRPESKTLVQIWNNLSLVE